MTSKTPELDIQQRKLLDLIKSGQFDDLTLKDTAKIIWAKLSQSVVNKLKQLEKKGIIRAEGTVWKYDRKRYTALDSVAPDVVYLPLLGFAQCGNFWAKTIEDETASEKLAFPSRELPRKNLSDIQRYFFVRAKGDSMEPKIRDWDLLLIRWQQDFDPSDMVLLVHDERPKIKYIKRTNGQYLLVSINPQNKDVEIFPTAEIFTAGIVKKIISNY